MRRTGWVLALSVALTGVGYGQDAAPAQEDLNPPQLTFDPASYQILKTMRPLRVTFDEDIDRTTFRAWLDGIEVTREFRTNQREARSSTFDIAPGDHNLMVEVRDRAGNRTRQNVTFAYAPELEAADHSSDDETTTRGGSSGYTFSSSSAGGNAGGPSQAPPPYVPPKPIPTGLDLPCNPVTHALFKDAAMARLNGLTSDDLPWDSGGDTGGDPSDEPPPVFFGEPIPSENDTIVYVIDISCSMLNQTDPFVGPNGNTMTGNRLDRAKAETIRSISALSESFEFNVVAYDCNTRTWSGGLERANESNKASASAWVNALDIAGGTGTGPAVSLGLSFDGVMAVAVLTDGEPNCMLDADGHREMIRNQNKQGARIDVFGIQATGVYRAWCQSVAAENSGTYFDVP